MDLDEWELLPDHGYDDNSSPTVFDFSSYHLFQINLAPHPPLPDQKAPSLSSGDHHDRASQVFTGVVPRTDFQSDDEEEDNRSQQLGGEDGINMWRWCLTGIGAMCSFGVVAATFCIISLSRQRRNTHTHPDQKLQFQIYTNDDQSRWKHI